MFPGKIVQYHEDEIDGVLKARAAIITEVVGANVVHLYFFAPANGMIEKSNVAKEDYPLAGCWTELPE